MAKRKKGRRSYGGGGRGGSVMDGVIGGASRRIGAQVLGPDFGPAAGLWAAGAMRRNAVLETLAGIELGDRLAANVNFGGMLNLGGGS